MDEVMAIDIERVRRDFPFLNETIYLNTAAAGISWSGQGAAAAQFYDRMLSRGYDGREEWRAIASRVQVRLAKLMHVEPESIGFVGSTTEALNLIAHAITVKGGERVVFAEDEFPSLRMALGVLGSKGADLRTVRIDAEARRTDRLCESVEGASIVGVSHVHWCTGSRVDLKRLAERCHEAGAWLIVDGIQALGAMPVDARRSDVYAGSVFKWLLSGFGLGILVVGGSLRASLNPAFRGYFNLPPSADLRYGHINYPGLCALDATLAYLDGLGWDNIFVRTAHLSERLIARLAACGIEVVTPRDQMAAIVSFRARDAEALVARLHEKNVRVEAREGLVRVSPFFYNTEGEIYHFCELLAAEKEARP
jgi:cysteine desulfurase / selenocysteine lyase